MAVRLRDATTGDAEAVAAIYAHHVAHGTASYDTAAPAVAETAAKIARIAAAGWPFLVAEAGAIPVGYAYATQFRDRAAYAWTCENSIYVHPAHQRRGVGRALLTELCRRAEAFGFRQMVAVIGGAEPRSQRLHEQCGFALAGRLHAVGWKHERWLDSLYMQRPLGVGSAAPPGA